MKIQKSWSCLLTSLSLLLFGSVANVQAGSTETCQQRAVHKDLYRWLHAAVAEHSCLEVKTNAEYVALLDKGIPLQYGNFNPGKPNRFTKPGALPQFVVENGQQFVDTMFPSGTLNAISTNQSQSQKEYHFDLISSTYDFVLTHMMVSPRNFSDQELLRAKYYLQELVPNPERVVMNQSQLPRFLLYDFYRKNYFEAKAKQDQAISNKRSNSLSQQDFESWGQKELPELQSDTESAFNKWLTFGYKSDVEKQLQYFDIDVHEDKLMSTRALFKSMEKPSESDPHKTVYPFTLQPEKWYRALQINLPESSDELRYQKSILRAQQALMNATKNDLSDDTNEDIKRTQDLIRKNLDELNKLIQNAVDKLLQMEVECFTHANISVCGDIIDGHTAFRYLLQNVSEHFAQQGYLESIIDGREESIFVLEQKLNEVQAKIKTLDQQIIAAQRREIAATIDASTTQNVVVASCPEDGKIHFTYNSQKTDVSSECQGEGNSPEDGQDYCTDHRIPVNATSQPLWNLRSCSVDSELKAFQVHSNFTSLMNSATAVLSATLLAVDVHRSWLDLKIFEDSDHYTMKRNRGVVSPGVLEPVSYFRQVAESGKYLMPQYITSFILASDVSVFYPGLGTWNDTDNDDDINGAIHILMKYAYAPNLAGGFGPFSFAPAGESQSNTHNFRVERKNGGVLLTIPGGQIIGYVIKVVPKFPHDQADPPARVPCTVHPAQHHQRRRRSIPDDIETSDTPSIQNLANSLFLKSFERSSKVAQEFLPKTEYVLSEALDKFMHESDATKERVEKFMETLDMEESHRATVLPMTQDQRSRLYHNDTLREYSTPTLK